MHLDSAVVQIDCYSKYLLISTQTRVYFCDTERQQYRQIGKKLREGAYGACFFNIHTGTDKEPIIYNKGLFQTLAEDDNFCSTNTNVQIYCARPGARLWEANFEAVVLKTHQFRSSLSQAPSELIHINDSSNERLNISDSTNVESIIENFNFGKLLNVLNKFILTYDKRSIFVFDPSCSSLVFWTNSFNNIRDIRIVNSLLYIWNNKLQINVLSLVTLEEIVLKTLLRKQYYLCADLCLHYSKELNELIESSNKLYLITSLKAKLLEFEELELLQRIEPTLNKIKELSQSRQKSRKLNNGIVVIDNAYKEHADLIPESVQNFTPKASSSKELIDDNIQVYTMYKQYKLHETHKNIDIPDFCKLFESDAVYYTIVKFVQYMVEEHNLDVKAWCEEQSLKQISKRCKILECPKLKEFLLEAFFNVNKTELKDLVCECGFPLPNLHNKEPKFYSLGINLLECDINDNIKRLPYLYKERLMKLKDLSEILDNLVLLIQFSDVDIFKLYLNKFTYDIWDETVKHLINLKKGSCLNCSQRIEVTESLSWTQLGLVIVQSIGAQNTTKLFKRYAQYIPKGELDNKFYQACIFATVADLTPQKQTGVSFLDEVLNSNSSCEVFVKYINNINFINLVSFSVREIHAVVFEKQVLGQI